MDGNNTPRILFPTDPIKLPRKNESVEDVIVYLKTVPETVVSIEFGNSAAANYFHDYVKDIIKNNVLPMC